MTPSGLVDDLGTPVGLAAPPLRVVSLVPSITEAIAATVPGALVGATQWCTHPADLDVTRVRGTKNPDLDAIRTLLPDLVIANQEENRKLDVERLRSVGIPVWVTRIDTVDEAFASLARLFSAGLGVAHTPGWLEEARGEWSRPQTLAELRVAIPVWRSPWTWVGAHTYSDDLLARLGCSNAVAAIGDRYPGANVERVLAERPDVVLLPDEPYPFGADDGPDAFPGLRTVLAPGRALFWYGPAMVGARRTLERLLTGS